MGKLPLELWVIGPSLLPRLSMAHPRRVTPRDHHLHNLPRIQQTLRRRGAVQQNLPNPGGGEEGGGVRGGGGQWKGAPKNTQKQSILLTCVLTYMQLVYIYIYICVNVILCCSRKGLDVAFMDPPLFDIKRVLKKQEEQVTSTKSASKPFPRVTYTCPPLH